MSLADLANIGELIAGVGVIVSLLYLAGQIRESRRFATWNAHLVISGSISEITADVAKDPELFRVWRAVLDSPADASDEDRERVGFILHQIFSAFENADRFGDPVSTFVFDPFTQNISGLRVCRSGGLGSERGTANPLGLGSMRT
ncbi:MAG: hypothetical protein JRH10_00370 [Deltaproteobacteria bacterium]|nr:hypothetical protein [Deltaproteobacteria bacterium]MBW2446351.1 hypothetical protein [Deltaproteobacteria bacterium]